MLSRIARRRDRSNEWSEERKKADAQELTIRQEQLAQEYNLEMEQLKKLHDDKEIGDDEYRKRQLDATRLYYAKREELAVEDDNRRREREKAAGEFVLQTEATVVQTVADFEKIASDKKLAQLDQEKTQRLAKLEAEYKAGTVSK